MGYQDRDYYRGKTSVPYWLAGDGAVCKILIFINVAAWILTKFNPNIHALFSLEITEVVKDYEVWRVLTAGFLHSREGVWHLLFNMLFLWMVGREMESLYGSRDFTIFYLTAIVFSNLVWLGLKVLSDGVVHGELIGASGGVMAVVVLYTLYYPRREVILILFPVEMWLLVLILVVKDLVDLTSGATEPVAFAAHLGGAFFGYAYKTFDLRFSRLSKSVGMTFKIKRRGLRVVSPEPRRPAPARKEAPPARAQAAPAPASKPSISTAISEETLDEKLDEILSKIARDGRSSITDEEKRILEEASRRARQRRGERSQ